MNNYHLKERDTHGTPTLPVSVYHLSYHADDENYFQLHWHEEVEFIVVLKGGILYTLDQQEIPLVPGEGLFVNTHRLHGAKSLGNEPCEACVVVFHPKLLNHDLSYDSYSRFVYPLVHRFKETPTKLTENMPWHRQLMSLITVFDNLKNQNLEDLELLVRGLIYQIWHLLYKNCPTTSPSTSHEQQQASYNIDRMKPVLAYIHTNFHEEITLDELSALIPMSKGQFCRVFKDIIGMSPISYLMNYRIEESCRLLKETDQKIVDISKQVGFNTISYFNREFQKRLSLTPKMYRKINRDRIQIN